MSGPPDPHPSSTSWGCLPILAIAVLLWLGIWTGYLVIVP